MRDHKERMAATESIGKLGKNGKIVVSGKTGESLLSEYTKALDEITGKFAL